MSDTRLMLDYVYEHELKRPNHVFLTQPVGAGQVVDYSWAQVVDQARRMAAHLKSQGFEPGARVAMLAKNSAHFMIAELAIWMAGYTTVAIFPTETASAVRYVLEHSEARLLFVGKLDNWDLQAPGLPANLPCIALPLSPCKSFETWDAITSRTQPVEGRPSRAPDDLAMLAYTSGSTGQPKGVMHSFASASSATECLVANYRAEMGEDAILRVLSYLPLAHVYERAYIECCALLMGTAHVYFAESLDTFIQDLRRARPTFFISVPRLWIKFQQAIFARIPERKLGMLLHIPVVGKLVGRKILTGLGLDQVAVAGSGSAPIPATVIQWYRRLGLPLLEGYAMTEDFACSHASTLTQNLPGCVGVAIPGVQVRISDDGEILIKSPGQFVGYYKLPELTAASFTADGFFKTGDLGELGAEGLLKLTGRKKELFKTGKGKYVAPAPIENRINAHPLVEMSIVSGVGQQAAYAMVVLTEDVRPNITDPTVRAIVEEELMALIQEINEDWPDHERLRMIVVAPEPWTIDNGCLTPTMKIKRNRIEADVAQKVDAWYHQPGPVLWA